MADDPQLTEIERSVVAAARRAVIVTLKPDGRPRPIPICFVLAATASVIYTAIDDKPKRSADPTRLARVRDIAADPRVSVLVDRWDEDWTMLRWVRLDGRATLIGPDDPGHAEAIAALRRKYPQYRDHGLEHRPVLAIDVDEVTSWSGAPTGS